MKIYIGYRLKFKEDPRTFEVIGNHKIRSNYIYIIKDIANGEKSSMKREALLKAIQSGDCTVSV